MQLQRPKTQCLLSHLIYSSIYFTPNSADDNICCYIATLAKTKNKYIHWVEQSKTGTNNQTVTWNGSVYMLTYYSVPRFLTSENQFLLKGLKTNVEQTFIPSPSDQLCQIQKLLKTHLYRLIFA